MAIETLPFDPAEYLTSPDAQTELIIDALDSGDLAYIAHALGTIARARGIGKIAKDAGLSRDALDRSLAPGGDPRLSTILGVMKALGIKLTARAL